MQFTVCKTHKSTHQKFRYSRTGESVNLRNKTSKSVKQVCLKAREINTILKGGVS